MKGIILAGGSGTRLHPITMGVSKQLLPIYNKPMIYYPLSVLLLAGIRQILIISAPQDLALFRRLLGDGSFLGVEISYAAQHEPRGLADAFRVGADFVGSDPVALILGDNIFHGPGLSSMLSREIQALDGCTLFGYKVSDPERFGVGVTDSAGRLVSLEEKPKDPATNRAITGLYLFDNEVLDIAKNLEPSASGELEITDVNRVYLEQGRARLVDFDRGFAWLDTGTHDSLLQAGEFVQILEHRQGVHIACIEEVALLMGFISPVHCYQLGERQAKSEYGHYVMNVALSVDSDAAQGHDESAEQVGRDWSPLVEANAAMDGHEGAPRT